ncbi:UDP-N-acetylglucosamine 1-carboxyvinyltransferase [Effusibacillus lacus]|uniref:UDP-N-acetylglucosamine 1-carboxyvinyltransferase n=1 Tax=Effusibacillus lacus TaxID=1348429 RepID=A0A292YRG7_9BACL|nr:UDP-N-acetylglucosamine 1-carboxyvinyltransferase [Effusibacillus lacus]TCS75683.1 UDP-N-acetylglucosamine 1-carboxyvinyltransferase [Effusibacillus lacus]GAX91004.1 UDP-N-acetylglucosamine 1-carboxyvinyltransferase [Effusibacillus lacus]
MERLAIEGGKPLIGSVRVHGAKNAALPILAASVMAKGESVIHDVPDLQDIRVMEEILRSLGARVFRRGSTVTVDPTPIHSTEVPDELMRQMRSSIFLMGPLLSRFGSVRVSKPGGCTIGSRPIDLHTKGLTAMGADIRESHGYLFCQANRLKGTSIYLDIPSVGATENILMAASLANGTTMIGNAAREPEIVDLATYLNKMGAKITGAGEDTIYVEGVAELTPTEHTIIPDRIVTGTLLVAAAVTNGNILLENVNPSHLGVVLTKLRETGVEIELGRDIMTVKSSNPLTAVDRIQTSYYPGFPTDLQAPFMAMLTVAKGTSIVSETVFEERFKHVSELRRMGARIKVDLRTAFIEGVPELTAASVEATDLRAGAALVIAGLAANGTTCVENTHHIDRGYERIEDVLSSLGARIHRIQD